jgi:hypothetical protein
MAGIAVCLSVLVAAAPAASQDLEVLAAAAGELRDMIDSIPGLEGGIVVAHPIHRGREGATWSGAALDILRGRLETVPPQPVSTVEVCKGARGCLSSGRAATIEISEPVWTGEAATVFARLVIGSARFPVHPRGDVVLVTLRLARAAVPGGWQIDRSEAAERSRISRAAGSDTRLASCSG